MRFLKLVQRIVLGTVREEWFLTVLSVLGIALGIGLFMGVNVATSRAVRSFEMNIAGLNPAFNYEVTSSSGIDFDEDIYKSVRNIEAHSMPLLETNAYLPAPGVSVDINGIYTVKALTFLGSSPNTKLDREGLFKNLNGVLITKRFAGAHGLKQGDLLDALVYDYQYRLKIDGVIDSPLVPGNTLFMDLGNFQEFFGKVGYLTRIDISTDEKKAEAIGKILPAGLSIEKKQKILQSQKALIDSFRFNLRFVTFLAVLAGVFLLYNTVFISVVKRRTEIGILRSLGMERKTVVALFSVQGMVLGLAGSLLGIVFGQVFAWFSTVAVEKTVTQFFRSVAVSDYIMTPGDALSALLLGITASFFASLIPALESAKVRPRESSLEGTFETAYKGRQTLFSLVGLVLTLLAVVVIYLDYRYVPYDFPWLSYAGIVLFILGCTLNAPPYLGASLTFLKRPLYKLFKAEARIAVGGIKGSRYRFSLALMSVAVSSALIVATISSVYSFKASFIDWIDTYITADVYVKPAACASNFCFSPLADEIEKTVEHAPGVENVGRYRALQIDFRGQKIVAGFGNSELLWKYRPHISQEEKKRIQRLAGFPEVSVSDYLRVKYGLKKGDTVELQTPRGTVPFVINNTSISYSTMSGFLYMDRRWLKKYWGMDDATSLSVYLAKGGDARKFIRNIDKTLNGKFALDITDNTELRQAALRIFDKSFALTYTIELIAIVISLIGVVNALLILVLEKKRELSVLRYLGASWRHLRRVAALSAGIIGLAGIALGCGMGWAISIVITHVINKISFGWEVGLRMPFVPLAVLMALLFVTTTAAGLVPASLARKIDPKAFISFE
jgi:putative ABC transport system permease protein